MRIGRTWRRSENADRTPSPEHRRTAFGASPLLIASLLSALAPISAEAQEVPADTATVDTTIVAVSGYESPRAGEASPPLPIDHWAVRAAWKAEAMGLLHDFLPAQRVVSRGEAARALGEAAERARTERPDLVELTEGWHRRFVEEFPEHDPEPQGGSVLLGLGGSLGAGVDAWEGRLVPAWRLFEERVDPQPLRDDTDFRAQGTFAAGAGPLAAMADVRVSEGGLRAPRWDVVAGVGRFAFAFGEEAVGYGPARSGGIVLTGAAPILRAQLETRRPLRLPSVLRYLGNTTFHTSFSRLDEPRHPGEPWMWTARMAFQPHPRFTVGISRASIFGGDSISTPTNLENVVKMFVGQLSDDFENQVVAVDGRLRLPTESFLPLTLYLEWGAEDAAGAWWDVPGQVFGAYAPALPGLPEVGVGAEFTRFEVFCCGNPPWYYSGPHPGGWVYEDVPLGHPLGGEGWEASTYAQAELLESRLRVEARGFLRDRSEEGFLTFHRAGNLYAPQRVGKSWGGSLDAAWRVNPKLDARLRLYRDAGDGWSEGRVAADLSYLF